MAKVTEMDLTELVMEYKLTVIRRIACVCAGYLVRRRKVIFQQVLVLAAESESKPADIFFRFQKRLHHNHCRITANN